VDTVKLRIKIKSDMRIEKCIEIDIKKQYLKRGTGDMKSPQKVSLDVMKNYAGL
jgi:hypothetical protein